MRAHKCWLNSLCSLSFALTLSATSAYGELDPELAAANNKNDTGFTLGAGVGFGQAYPTSGGSPGTSYQVHADPTFVFRKDSWARMEAGLRLGTGQISFRSKEDPSYRVVMPLTLITMAKFGYGYSVGDSSFMVWNLGVGPVNGRLGGKVSTGQSISSDPMWGVAAMAGFEVILPASPTVDMTAGLSFTHLQFNTGDVKVGDTTVDYGEPIEVNMPELHVGIRKVF